ncbi:response regulator [Prosthecobacter sp.]|uniref:ATP-binding response regulator n=1 Tax=Prosthecobacter sp. TaxID=1965333 RepID=UPI002489D090|nr:response regulator [Prosthecobacter sp.]MDI1312738.1 response regulator [Prosthecobacter sp.]
MPHTSMTASNRRILVIDDNRSIHADFRKILAPSNAAGNDLEAAEAALFGTVKQVQTFTVDTASQGEEGLQMVKLALEEGRPYAMAFVDVRMPPGWDGIETTRQIWQVCPDMQIVICTAYADCNWSDVQEQIKPRDRMLILKKPFDIIEVLQLAISLTEKSRLLQESKSHLRDLEQRVKQRTQELEASQMVAHEKASLLDLSRDVILVCGLDHHVTYWNKSAERLYGWTSAEAVGRLVSDNIKDKSPEFFQQAYDKVLQTGEWDGELQQVGKDGRNLVVEGRWTLLRDAAGQPRSILVVNTDITERKKFEDQMLRAQRMESLGTLAGGIAHDLNNALTPIMMSIELLKLHEQDAMRMGVLATIENSARRGAEMVRQVLSFSRGVEGQRVEVQAGHLLKGIEKIANETFLKNIRVSSDIPANLWIVQGDPTQIHQMLLNMCVNARDAMPNGGTLNLSASNQLVDEQCATMMPGAKSGPYLLVELEDTGTGMPPEVIDRIFEPFFTTKDLGKGTGLGLSSSLAIIKSHKGFIRATSEMDKGSKFQVYLPAQMAEGVSIPAPVETELPRGNGELVLLIDDEEPVRHITGQTLESFGYRVLPAADGVEASSLYAAHKEKISVVLTDMMMPVMDGPATIQVLMRMDPKVRIIAASGLSVKDMVLKATSAGVKNFIPKPYTAETLLRMIHAVLNIQPVASP